MDNSQPLEQMHASTGCTALHAHKTCMPIQLRAHEGCTPTQARTKMGRAWQMHACASRAGTRAGPSAWSAGANVSLVHFLSSQALRKKNQTGKDTPGGLPVGRRRRLAPLLHTLGKGLWGRWSRNRERKQPSMALRCLKATLNGRSGVLPGDKAMRPTQCSVAPATHARVHDGASTSPSPCCKDDGPICYKQACTPPAGVAGAQVGGWTGAHTHVWVCVEVPVHSHRATAGRHHGQSRAVGHNNYRKSRSASWSEQSGSA